MSAPQPSFASHQPSFRPLALLAVLALASLQACSHADGQPGSDLGAGQRKQSQTIFEIAMIPDTQNYVDTPTSVPRVSSSMRATC